MHYLESYGLKISGDPTFKPLQSIYRPALSITEPALALKIRDVTKLLQAIRLVASYGKVDLGTAAGIYLSVISGQADLLLGLAEGGHFDAKRAHYSLASDRARYEFALDLASFANSPTGGAIVIGVDTKKDTIQRDIVHQVVGVKAQAINADQIISVANSWIVPPIDGLDISTSRTLSGKDVAVILIPPQLPALQPFLVRGGELSGKITRTLITLPV